MAWVAGLGWTLPPCHTVRSVGTDTAFRTPAVGIAAGNPVLNLVGKRATATELTPGPESFTRFGARLTKIRGP